MPPTVPGRAERWILLAFSGFIVLAAIILVLRNRPVDGSLLTPLRFLLALAAAAMGGVAPGALLKLDFERGGVVIRGAGAAALFIAVWFGGR